MIGIKPYYCNKNDVVLKAITTKYSSLFLTGTTLLGGAVGYNFNHVFFSTCLGASGGFLAGLATVYCVAKEKKQNLQNDQIAEHPIIITSPNRVNLPNIELEDRRQLEALHQDTNEITAIV